MMDFDKFDVYSSSFFSKIYFLNFVKANKNLEPHLQMTPNADGFTKIYLKFFDNKGKVINDI